MKYEIGNTLVKVLGDPHLGRRFVNNVPLDRRGEREEQVWEEFERQLHDVADCTAHVCLGDLFDGFLVPPEVILRAAKLYKEAAERHPATQYVVLSGNHDLSRDVERASAFDVFAELVGRQTNLKVIKGESKTLRFGAKGDTCLGFVPWHPVKSANEMVAELPPCDAVFVHMDLDSFGGSDHNLMPRSLLAEKTDWVIGGHVHRPLEVMDGDLRITIHGSMLPYAHGEDATGETYVTLTLSELKQLDPDALQDKCVRILLLPGESLDVEINALQVSTKRVEIEEDAPLALNVDEFNLAELFHQVLGEMGVRAELIEQTWQHYMTLKSKV